MLEKPEDIFKDPYILEFTGLPEMVTYSETELENRIIDNLQKFLLELGRGFTFVGRQVRFNFSVIIIDIHLHLSYILML